MPGDRDKCITHGMTDYLTKPMSKQGLHKMITRYHTLSRWVTPSPGGAIGVGSTGLGGCIGANGCG